MSIPRSAAGSISPANALSMPLPGSVSTTLPPRKGAMAEDKKSSYQVGFGKPPRSTQFKSGQSGNPKGRPKGGKNFATALEEELKASVTITENGKRRKIAKRQVIAKLLVNKAATGDLRAIPLLLNETRIREGQDSDAEPDQVFDTPD